MKKRNKKIIISLLIVLTLFVSMMNVNAKACSKYKVKKCPSKCAVVNNKCTTKEEAKKKAEKDKKNCEKNCKNKSGGGSALTACLKTCSDTGATPVSVSSSQTGNVDFCASTAKVWKIVGSIFTVFKILIPIILIITGSIDFGKALLSSDDNLFKAVKKVITRLIIAVVIFLLPSLVTMVIGLFVGFSEDGVKEDYEYCKSCINSPSKCDTSKDASTNK